MSIRNPYTFFFYKQYEDVRSTSCPVVSRLKTRRHHSGSTRSNCWAQHAMNAINGSCSIKNGWACIRLNVVFSFEIVGLYLSVYDECGPTWWSTATYYDKCVDIKLTFGHVNPVGCRRSSCSFFLSLSVLFCLRFCLVLFYLYIAFLFVVGCCSEFLFLGRFTNSSYQHHPELKNKKKKGKNRRTTVEDNLLFFSRLFFLSRRILFSFFHFPFGLFVS